MAERFTKTKSRCAPHRGKTIYQEIRLRTAKDDEIDELVPPGTSPDVAPDIDILVKKELPRWYPLVPSTNSDPEATDEGVLF